MKYLSENGHQLVTKNKLQKAVQECLKGYDRLLIKDNKELTKFKAHIVASIVLLNIENPRCAGISARWMEVDKNDWLLTGVDFSHFMIKHVKQDFKPNEKDQ